MGITFTVLTNLWLYGHNWLLYYTYLRGYNDDKVITNKHKWSLEFVRTKLDCTLFIILESEKKSSKSVWSHFSKHTSSIGTTN